MTAIPAGALGAAVLYKLNRRLQLSRAKHRSLQGHARMSRLLAGWLPYYSYSDTEFYRCDGAPAQVADQRRQALSALGQRLQSRNPRSQQCYAALEAGLADVQFVNNYRVPYQFREVVREKLKLAPMVEAASSNQLRDLDGNWAYDLGGSYGVNLLGYEFYQSCMRKGLQSVAELGPVLGPYHPIIEDNLSLLRQVSGHEQASFHMSGTEAVMQATRLARYHTGRSHIVRFCGAYHGWWDGVQPGIGNPRPVNDIYTLSEMSTATLKVLRTRKDIACVLVNPLQAMHPNAGAPGDAMLIASDRSAGFDRDAYGEWLRQLRQVCDEKSIVLIFDEVFLGFRLALGGAQEYFGVRADMVTYGKTLGGGLPIGVVCGKPELMKRYRDDRPSDICFARGTFNSHPLVMACTNEFLRHVTDSEQAPDYASLDRVWSDRLGAANARFQSMQLPIRVAGMSSIWTVLYTQPGRYNWLLQYYLADQLLLPSWIGSGRFIFQHDLSDEDFRHILEKITAAAMLMQADGWWWRDEALDDRAIKRRVLGEILMTRLLGRRLPAPTKAAAVKT